MTPETTPKPTDPSAPGDELQRAVGGEIPLDVMFEILKNGRRRMVLQYLKDHDGQVKLSDLADVVTAMENDTDVESITSTERKRVYVGLYQFHLPKMDDMDIIDFDQDRGNVSLAEKGRKLLKAHERNNAPSRRWHCLYVPLAGIGLLAIGAVAVTQSLPLALALFTLQTIALATIGIAQTLEYHQGLPKRVRTPRLRVHKKLPYLNG